ncbi:MAG: class I tRNA ligase family protein, partial [Dehalococcoidales bacterium]|nr:class I tRNA ligase family protein [Dehalococcoidales bacterium]
GEPSWESPWGPGRPGWHIECSAMSLKYLGNALDIHGGGRDLIFPHHENEIAQSESFTGKKPVVRYWLHNGLVQMGEEKMSKSLGNLITIREALEKYSADAIRIFSIGSYYRSPLTYSEEILEAAEKGSERLRQVAHSADGGEKSEGQIDTESYRNRFIEAMDDDFGTSQALATLFDLARDMNRLSDGGIDTAEARETLTELGGALGLTFEAPKKPELDVEPLRELLLSTNENRQEAKLGELSRDGLPDEADSLLELITTTRTGFRGAKLWQAADEIRNKLDELGITLEDTARGTEWKYKR